MLNLVCICIDHMPLSLLGCYGNSWSDTAALDRLAAESFTCDGFITDSTDLATVYSSLWRGVHAASQQPHPAPASLAQLATAAGLHTAVITDAEEVAIWAANHDFAEVITTAEELRTDTAPSIEQTQFAALFGSAIQWLTEASEPNFLWLHSRGLGAPWDAPLELRNQFVEDEEEPLPPSGANVPHLELPDDFDPDELLGLRRAAAGQVAALDTCLDALLEFLHEQQRDQNTAIVLLAPRGLALGEHRIVGANADFVHEELVHVPLLIRMPNAEGAGQRGHTLLQPMDLFATLAELLTDTLPATTQGRSLLPLIHGESGIIRQRTLTMPAAHATRLFRTPAWALLQMADKRQLFVKPDDRWEQNEISARVPEITEQLSEELERMQAALSGGTPTELPPLPETLTHGPE